MPLTPKETGWSGPRYAIPFSASVAAADYGASAPMPAQCTLSVWFQDGADWTPVCIQKYGNAVSVSVGGAALVSWGTTARTVYAALLKDVLNSLFGDYRGGWAELVCLAGLHAPSEFAFCSGSACRPLDPVGLSFADAADAWLDFADPSGSGQIPREGGWDAADVSQAVSSSGYTFLDATHAIPAGTIVTGVSVYAAAGYATEDSELCIYRKTGALTGVAVRVTPVSISALAGWHSAAFDYAVPDDGSEYYAGVYSNRTVSMTTSAAQGTYGTGDRLAQGSSFTQQGTFRAPIIRWSGHRVAGLGQDVSGNGNHWDLTATQSTSTPTT